MKIDLELHRGDPSYIQFCDGLRPQDNTGGFGVCEQENELIDHVWDHYGCEFSGTPKLGDLRALKFCGTESFAFVPFEGAKVGDDLEFGVASTVTLGHIDSRVPGVWYPSSYIESIKSETELDALHQQLCDGIANGEFEGVERFEHSKLMFAMVEGYLELVVFTPIVQLSHQYCLVYSKDKSPEERMADESLLEIGEMTTRFVRKYIDL